MKIIDALIGRTQSAAESSIVALNAHGEAYAYLEAVRKGTLGPLLQKAYEKQVESGVDPQKAMNDVATRGQYLKELSEGKRMFHEADAELKQEAKSTAMPYKPA